jgi:spore coat polysaccharide biosynthesis protein SpsF (cytidylyltransferase family)
MQGCWKKNTTKKQISMDRIFVMIPARGGSKRLQRKNIFPVLGKPIVQYTIEAALKSSYIQPENIYVSTEDKEIENVVKPFCKVISRPEALAGDKVWTQDVINHFIEVLALDDEDIVVVLQANSPEITTEIIDKALGMLLENKLWQVHSVDQSLINNGAIQIMRAKVGHHKGKPNYNGIVITDWIDLHTIEDVKDVEKRLIAKGYAPQR